MTLARGNTDVALLHNGNHAPPPSLIQQTALDLGDAHKIAAAICATQLAPKDYRGKPDDGAAAIMLGATLGLHPMTALQNIFIVHGSPSMYARTMAAVVRAAGHELWTDAEADGTVTVCGRRRGSEHVESVTYTIGDAQKAGYVKQNSKYTTDPTSMLYARALSIACRRTAPDALLGIPYSLEELADQPRVIDAAPSPPRVTAAEIMNRPSSGVDVETGEIFDEPPSSSGVAAGPLSEAESGAESGFDPRPASDPHDGITDAQMRKMQAGFRDLGVTDRDDRIGFTAEFLGRGITSAKDLSKDEASALIDDLERRAATRDEHPDDEETDTP